jgi:hypothetical protein
MGKIGDSACYTKPTEVNGTAFEGGGSAGKGKREIQHGPMESRREGVFRSAEIERNSFQHSPN